MVGPARPISERRRSASALVAATALAASVRGVLNDFVYDDIPLIRDNLRLHAFGRWPDIVTHPYWPPPFVEQLYRPLSLLFLAAQYAIGGGSPLVFRLVSYALYAAAAIAVLRLGERILPRPFAFGAALLFAAHPVHTEAVALGVNQSELLVAILGLTMTIRYLDARRDGTLSVREWAILAALYAAACLCKENGFVIPGLLVSAELVLLTEAPPPRRARFLWIGYLVLAAVAMSILMLRHAVLANGAVTVVAAKGLEGVGFGGRMVIMLQVVPQWLRLLAWPRHLQADYVASEFFPSSAVGMHEVPGLAILVAAIAAIWLSRRRAPVVCFGLVWCAVTLLPVSNIVPTGILLAERTLFLPSVGFLIAAAGVAALAVERWPSTAVKRCLVASATLLVMLGVVRSTGRHAVWNTAHLQIVTRPPRED